MREPQLIQLTSRPKCLVSLIWISFSLTNFKLLASKAKKYRSSRQLSVPTSAPIKRYSRQQDSSRVSLTDARRSWSSARPWSTRWNLLLRTVSARLLRSSQVSAQSSSRDYSRSRTEKMKFSDSTGMVSQLWSAMSYTLTYVKTINSSISSTSTMPRVAWITSGKIAVVSSRKLPLKWQS